MKLDNYESSGSGAPNPNEGSGNIRAHENGERSAHDAEAIAATIAELKPVQGPSPQELADQESREAESDGLAIKIGATQGAMAEQAVKLEAEPQFIEGDWRLWLWIKILLGSCGCLLLQAASAANAARFVVDETQSMLLALVFVGVVPAVAVGFEVYAHRLSKRRSVLECVLGYVFVFSFLTFLWEFANEFALVPGVEELGSVLGGFDFRVMLISQTLVEVAVTFGLFSKIRIWVEELPEPRINPRWRVFSEEMERLDGTRQEYLDRLNHLRAESAAFKEKQERIRARQRKLQKFLQS